MFKTISLVLISLSIAVGGGAASVWYALDRQTGIETLRVGPWRASPEFGTPDASPYAKAELARRGTLVLGHAEGLSFVAATDDAHAPLSRRCSYSVAGNTPPARFWTLYATDSSAEPLAAAPRRPRAIFSRNILRQPDDSFLIAVGPHAAPGNWLPVEGTGAMRLVLTLYDSPVASNTEIARIELPRVTRLACDG